MQVLGINSINNYRKTENKASFSRKSIQNHTMPQRNTISNVYYMPMSPNFKGIRFETNVVQKVAGKKYQGLGLYTQDKNFIDFLKVGYDKLASEPLDITKATKNEIAAHRFSLALSETYAIGSDFGTQWVKRYNPGNRNSPLAVSHTLNSESIKEGLFAPNLELLYDQRFGKSLDIPITDKKGNLILDAVVFDTETTGTNPGVDKIVQIATMQLKKGKIVPEKSVNQLINPGIPIPKEAENVHGISDKMVRKAPKMEEYLEGFLDKTLSKKNGIVVAYNSKFDVPLLNRYIREHNVSDEGTKLKEKSMAKVLDPFILMQRIHPFLGAKKKLGYQYHWLFCKPMENAHDALADVNGTVDVLKYCLYYLSEHRRDKSVPLTLREVLIFQNGGHGVKNINIPLHPSKNYSNLYKFNESYRSVPLDVDNYFQGYKLSKKVVEELTPEIGENNAKKLLRKDFVNTSVTEQKNGKPVNAGETKKDDKTDKFKTLSYVTENNFKKVLKFAKLEDYNGKSAEEIENLITEKSKTYVKEGTKEIWFKNVDPNDIPHGNDLPDDNITRRVMNERKNNKD